MTFFRLLHSLKASEPNAVILPGTSISTSDEPLNAFASIEVTAVNSDSSSNVDIKPLLLNFVPKELTPVPFVEHFIRTSFYVCHFRRQLPPYFMRFISRTISCRNVQCSYFGSVEIAVCNRRRRFRSKYQNTVRNVRKSKPKIVLNCCESIWEINDF